MVGYVSSNPRPTPILYGQSHYLLSLGVIVTPQISIVHVLFTYEHMLLHVPEGQQLRLHIYLLYHPSSYFDQRRRRRIPRPRARVRVELPFSVKLALRWEIHEQ
jgi:hypothetical protein